MGKDEIAIVRDFGHRLIENEFNHFIEDPTDNSEYVSAIKRITDAAYIFLKEGKVSVSICASVKNELISKARELFVKEWMKPLEGDDETPDTDEAKEEFDYLLNIE